jgi:large repetitive protein
LAPIYLGSGGSGVSGAAGGGLVILDIGGTLTVDGSISADGSNSPGGWDGGGSGGSVYVMTNILAGSGTISVDGGNGNDGGWDGGGGGGGRAAVYYNTNSLTLTGITSVGGWGDESGQPGSTFILNRKIDDGIGDVRITSGIDIQDGDDYARTNITIDSGATLTCPETITTLNFTATGNIIDNGSTWNCDGAITTFNLSADTVLTTAGITWDFSNTDQFNLSTPTWTNTGTNVFIVDKDGSKADWDISNDLTLTNMTYTGGTGGTASSTGGVLTLDNVIDIVLVNSDINSSVDWQNLTTLNIDADSVVNASSKGCLGGKAAREAGYGPNPGDSYKCAQGQASAGQGGHDAGSGGGYGGNGGDGSYRSDTFGTTYVYEATPIYLGSGGSGGNTGNGGNGGGSIRIDVSDTITVDGNISSNGESPTWGQGGGGSGGSVYISTINLDGAAYITANGGDGEDGGWDGGGGGGGRVAIYYAMLVGFDLLNVTSDGGATPGGSEAGDDGTVYPVLIMQYSSGAYKDTNADGQVDRVDITFNKTATLDECEAGDYTFGGADAGTIAVASCATDGSDLQLTISNAPANDTSLTLT